MTGDPFDLVRAANPVPALMLTGQDSRRADELLAQLLGTRSGQSHAPAPSHGGRGARRVLVATIAATAFVAAGGVAVAENVTPFDSIAAFVGISSANHTDAAADALDPQSLQMIERWNEVGTQLARRSGTAPRLALPSTARLINQFPSGRRFYVVSTTTSDLCVLVAPAPGSSEGPSLSCGNPLSQTKPTTIASQDFVVSGPNATPPFTFGVARDNVTAVSFMTASGSETTVQVTDNAWAYEGANNALESLTVRYADGSTQTIAR